MDLHSDFCVRQELPVHIPARLRSHWCEVHGCAVDHLHEWELPCLNTCTKRLLPEHQYGYRRCIQGKQLPCSFA